METYHGFEELKASLGQELGPGDWFALDQARLDGFADVTEDHQWIHVDPGRAASGPFGATVAHGFLTLSLVPHLVAGLRTVDGVKMGINYGLDKVRFPAAVTVGSRIRGRATMTEFTELGEGAVQMVTRVTLEIEDNTKPACVADMVSRYYF